MNALSTLSNKWITKLITLLPAPTLTAYIKDVKNQGVPGGTFESGFWRIRTLNNHTGNMSIVTLNDNQIILKGVGIFSIDVHAPAWAVRYHQARIKDVTNDVAYLGESSYAYFDTAANSGGQSVSVAQCIIETTTSETIIEIYHACGTTVWNSGFGVANGFSSTEIYTQVKIIKLR